VPIRRDDNRGMNMTNDSLRAALAIGLSTLAFAAHAMGAPDCAPEDLAPVDGWLARHPWKAGATTPDARVTAACKLWPYDKSVLIVAAAYAQDKERDKNLVVALVDTKSMSIRSAFQGVVAEDATWSVIQGSLRLDTARYDLAPGVRAFGVDIASDPVDNAVVRGGVTATRSLFVQQGTQLRLVLDGFVLATSTKSADGVTRTASKIAIDSHASHGFADLLVTRSIDPAPAGAGKDHATLAFDGTLYGAPGAGFTRHQVGEQ